MTPNATTIMDITGITTSINTDLLTKSPQAVVDAWKVGQLVNATAISEQKNGQATVNINGAVLLAQTQFPLKPGQPLQLEVTSLAAQTVLKIIASSTSSTTNTPPITVSLQPQNDLVSQLRAGQQLTANLPQTVDANQTRALLELAGNRVSVQLSQPLPSSVGQQIKLEVVSPGAIPALKILAATTDSSTISEALRTTLPRQAPLPTLLGNLALIAKNNPTNKVSNNLPQLPQPLVELVRAVVDRLPRVENLTSSDGLKQAVAQSGLFMEARLAQSLQQQPNSFTSSTTSPPIDFKGGLLSLLLSLLNFTKAAPSTPINTGTPQPNATPQSVAHALLNQQLTLQQALTELQRHVESGLSRIQLSQLVSSPPEEDGKRTWVVEIPMRTGEHIDLIQMKIKKESTQKNSKKVVFWTVTLALELSGLGPLHARVTLADKTINTSFWADNAQTTELIKTHFKILQQRYREVGLNVGTLNAHHGKAPEPVSPDANLPHILLDEKV